VVGYSPVGILMGIFIKLQRFTFAWQVIELALLHGLADDLFN